MPKIHHRLVLGVLEDIPQGIELYQALISDGCEDRHPIILSHTVAGDHESMLRDAGLAENGLVEGVQIHHANVKGSDAASPEHSPEALISKLLEHSPEVFWSLFDDFLSKGKILVALNLEGMRDAEIRLTKLILKYAIDRVHLIDLV